MSGRPALADDVAQRARPVALAGEHRLPVVAPLEALLPEGLRRGTTVTVAGVPGSAVGVTSLALALAAGASAAGSWVAAVGLPSLGLVAAAELGLSLERMAMVAAPASGPWATVVATLVDAFDVVLLGRGHRLRAADGRRLAARARERGAVLVVIGGDADGLEVDTRLRIVDARWSGVGHGDGHLSARWVTVEASGRRAATRPRRADLWLPGPDGIAIADTPLRVLAQKSDRGCRISTPEREERDVAEMASA